MLQHYSDPQQIHILEQMTQISNALSQYELTSNTSSPNYERYLTMLEQLEQVLLSLRDSKDTGASALN